MSKSDGCDQVFDGGMELYSSYRNSLKLSFYKLKEFLISFLLVLSFQTTDITLFNIKLGEYVFLIIFMFIGFRSKINKNLFYFYMFLVFLIISTFIVNLKTTFWIPNTEISFLKQPYVITIVRVIELILCTTVVLFLTYITRNKSHIHVTGSYVIRYFFKINSLFSILYIVVYLLHVLGFCQTRLIYGPSSRLRGFFVEGGPLGLYYAFLFLIGFFLKINKVNLLLYLVIIYLAQSKAGVSFIVFFMLFYFFVFRIKSICLKVITTILVILLSLCTISLIANNYIRDIENLEILLQTRASDPSFVMGRIAGLFIGFEMIKRNPLFGIGLGNYPLVRNDPSYLGLFPQVDEWDLTGLGIFTLIVENGFIGFLIFSLIIYSIYKNTLDNGKIFVLIFYFVFFFGVQLYFLYPWFALAIAVSFFNKKKYYQ